MIVVQERKKINMPYFDIEQKCKEHNIPLDNEKSKIIFIVGERDIGKTWSILNYVFNKKKIDIKNKIAFMRNTQEQFKKFRAEFNSYFAQQYKMTTTNVFNMKQSEVVTKEKEKIDIWTQNEMVGYCTTINNPANAKGVFTSDTKWLIYDEFIEDREMNQFQNFIDIYMTYLRNSEITAFCLANRVTPNNEFLVKFGIEVNTDFTNDNVYEVIPNEVWYIDLGTEQFKDIHKGGTLAHRLAKFDKSTDRYLNKGGYLIEPSLKIIPYEKAIKPSATIICGFVLSDKKITLVKFLRNNTEVYALVENDTAFNDRLKNGLAVFSLNKEAYQNEESIINSSEQQNKWVQWIVTQYKKGLLYFDSFDVSDLVQLRLNLVSFEDFFK